MKNRGNRKYNVCRELMDCSWLSRLRLQVSTGPPEHSLSAIGEAFGGRDHGTVLHACRLVKDRMEIDANVRQTVHYREKQLLR